MSITRHNYEEFFLLLADGELNPKQEEEVLQFAKQHPDLAEELDILMTCRLDAEIPPIFPREKILKPVLWNVDAPDEMQLQLLSLLDGELNEGESKLLHEEIANNPVLQLDWQSLKANAKLEAEKAPQYPKEKILKPTIWNIEQPDTVYVQMMNLLDNELSATEKLQLEQKIAADKGLQIEWQSLQRARLSAEAVVFPNKENLYRQTEQRRIGGWMRWAAAAAVIFGVGLFFWPKADNINNGRNTIAVNNTKPNNKVTETTDNSNTKTGINATKNPVVDLGETPIDTAVKDAGNTAQTTSVNKNNIASITVPVSKNNSTNTNEKTTGSNKNALAKQNTITANDGGDNGKNNTANTNTIAANNNTPADIEPPFTSNRKTITGSTTELNNPDGPAPKQLNTVAANMQANKNTMFRTASLTEKGDAIENNNPDDDVVYIAGARLNKQKVRGVFRGITRSLGRTFTKSKVEADNETQTLSRTLKP